MSVNVSRDSQSLTGVTGSRVPWREDRKGTSLKKGLPPRVCQGCGGAAGGARVGAPTVRWEVSATRTLGHGRTGAPGPPRGGPGPAGPRAGGAVEVSHAQSPTPFRRDGGWMGGGLGGFLGFG